MGASRYLVGHSLAIFIVSIVMLIISILTVSMRTFVRLRIVRAFGWDDSLMLAALALFLTLNACSFVSTMNGAGVSHNREFTDHEAYRKALLFWWLSQIFYIWSSALAKISIAVALLRLTVNKVHHIIIWSTIGLTVAISIMFWLVLMLNCHPISYFWNYADPRATGTCLSVNDLVKAAYVYSCLTIVSDLTLGILPIFLVWKLHMSRRTKIAVAGILSMGAIASVAVIIRIPFLHFYADANFLNSTYQIAIWSVIETGLGITASSLFTLRPLFRWLLDEKFSYGRSSREQGRGSQKYPLSSLNNDGLREPRDIGVRPQNNGPGSGSKMMNAMAIPPSRDFPTANSSEEALYPEPSRITVQRTFVRTISERND